MRKSITSVYKYNSSQKIIIFDINITILMETGYTKSCTIPVFS